MGIDVFTCCQPPYFCCKGALGVLLALYCCAESKAAILGGGGKSQEQYWNWKLTELDGRVSPEHREAADVEREGLICCLCPHLLEKGWASVAKVHVKLPFPQYWWGQSPSEAMALPLLEHQISLSSSTSLQLSPSRVVKCFSIKKAAKVSFQVGYERILSLRTYSLFCRAWRKPGESTATDLHRTAPRLFGHFQEIADFFLIRVLPDLPYSISNSDSCL